MLIGTILMGMGFGLLMNLHQDSMENCHNGELCILESYSTETSTLFVQLLFLSLPVCFLLSHKDAKNNHPLNQTDVWIPFQKRAPLMNMWQRE